MLIRRRENRFSPTLRTDDEYGEENEILTGIRKDSLTYVFERGGTYTFPPVSLHWWNTETKQVETAEIPRIVFQVKKSFTQHIEDLPRPVIFTVILIVLALILFIIYFRKLVSQSIVSSWMGFYRSESKAFLGAIGRILFSDLRTAYLGILGWRRRIEPDSVQALGSKSRSSILALEDSIYGPDSRKVSYGLIMRVRLVSELLTLRSSIRANQRLRDSGVGSLNPF